MFRRLFGNRASVRERRPDFGFAVVDVETTGLAPRNRDRIVEIAIVRLDADGELLDEFSTLINPERDIGPTRIHGISTRDVLGAPVFRDVAGDVAAWVKESVLVAHNAQFDSDFLGAEFARLGHELPPSPAICTLHLARRTYQSLSSYKLTALCTELGIRHEGSHSALGDARATASLFKTLLHRVRATEGRSLAHLGCSPTTAPLPSTWPLLERTGRRLERTEKSKREEPSFLAALAGRVTTIGATNSINAVEYIDLLNRVLEDRRVTTEEAELLLETANRWGLSQEEVRRIHLDYFTSLVALARQDGVITASEMADLYDVGELFGHTRVYMEQSVSAPLETDTPSYAHPRLMNGLSVCFTGESGCTQNGFPIDRSDAERFAARAGLIVKSSVTKKLDILVLADPDSLSGKAQKARRYGTRLMAEPLFWREIGITVD